MAIECLCVLIVHCYKPPANAAIKSDRFKPCMPHLRIRCEGNISKTFIIVQPHRFLCNALVLQKLFNKKIKCCP